MLFDQQYDDTVASVLCIFAVFKYDRDTRSVKGHLDFRGMPYFDWCCGRMALDFIKKNQMESDDFPGNHRIRRFYGQYGHRNGKYLSFVCAAVRRGKRGSRDRRMGIDHGNGYCIRDTGGNRSSDTGYRCDKSTFASDKEIET